MNTFEESLRWLHDKGCKLAVDEEFFIEVWTPDDTCSVLPSFYYDMRNKIISGSDECSYEYVYHASALIMDLTFDTSENMCNEFVKRCNAIFPGYVTYINHLTRFVKNSF